jgi:hypothetical protein
MKKPTPLALKVPPAERVIAKAIEELVAELGVEAVTEKQIKRKCNELRDRGVHDQAGRVCADLHPRAGLPGAMEARPRLQIKPMSPPMTSTPDKVHSPFGGSIAARILKCPASVGLVAKVPKEPPSVYAKRGTDLHAALVSLIEGDETFESLVVKDIVAADDLENAIRPAFAYAAELLGKPEAEYFIEQPVTFPGIAGAFGTLDLIVRIAKAMHVIDYKFGFGVRVRATSPAEDDINVDVANPQIIYYACAARHTFPEFFDGVEQIMLTIVQPTAIQTDEIMSSTIVTHADLDRFEAELQAACKEALGPSPRLHRGQHCRFCPAKPICPEHTRPLTELVELMPAFTKPEPAETYQAYLELLGHALTLLDAIKDFGTMVREEAKRAIEAGDTVPGYALSAGRAMRAWSNSEHTTIAALIGAGLARTDVIAEELRSVKQVEIRAKARGVKIPSELVTTQRSGVSLVRSENVHIPMHGLGEVVELFSAALAAVHNGKGGRRIAG